MVKHVLECTSMKDYSDHYLTDYVPETKPVGNIQPREGAGGLPHRKVIIRKNNG